MDISFTITHITEPLSTEVKTHISKPSNSHYLLWISSPLASAKQYSTSTDCSDDGWVGGGLWEWLDRVAPTPHWPEQQTECTHSSAKDKASAIICGGTAVCVCSVSRLAHNFKLYSFLRWSLEGPAGCQSHSDVIMLYTEWLYKEPYSELRQGTIMGPVLTDTAAWKYF